MEFEQQIGQYNMVQQVYEWCENNRELIMECVKHIVYTPCPSPCPSPSLTPCSTQQTVKQYQKRSGPIKATEHERAVSRAYYIANREAILEKRRIYHLKIKRYQKNLKNKDRPMKS